MRTICFCVLVLACGCAATGLPDKPVLKDYALSQRDFPLKSGLRVVVQEDHSSPMVTVVAVYNVGSTSDPKGNEGMAHLVEHLAFRNHPGGRAEQLWDHLKHAGASFNAFTEYDFTAYYESTHKENLPLLLQLEAWRLARTLDGVTNEVFLTEREVVRNELRQSGETSVGGKLFDRLSAQLFPVGHPLARPIVGTHDSLSATTLADAQKFAKDHYRPDNCTMVVTGDVDPKEVGKLLDMWPDELKFGPGGPDGPAIPPRQRIIDRPSLPVPPPVSTTLVRDKGPVEQPVLVLGWSAPGGRRRNDAVLRFAAARLNLAIAEGLEVKEEDDIEGAGAGVETFADGSMLLVFVDLKPGADPEAARKRILDTVVNSWTTELGSLLTEAVRWNAATGLLLETADPVGTSTSLAIHLAATGRTRYFADSLDDLAKVRAGDAMDLAYKFLQRDRSSAVYFEPESQDAPKVVGGGGGSSGGRRASHDVGRDTTGTAAGLGPERILQVARSPGLANVPRWKLANGLELVAIKHGTAPVAQMMVGIRGGDASLRPFGAASFTSFFTSTRCQDHGSLSPVGGRLGGFTGNSASTYFVDVISGNLANGIAVLSDELSCLEVNEDQFLYRGRLLDRMKKRYDRAAKLPDFLATQLFWNALYPDHPYGKANVDPDTLKPVTFEDASAWVRGHYRPGNAVAAVVGDVDPNEVKALAEKYLVRWTGGGGAFDAGIPAAPRGPSARKVYLIDRPKGTQAEVRIGCRLANAGPEQVPAFQLIGALVNERAWSVREQWGATYGIHARTVTLAGGAAHLMLSGAVVNKQAGASVERLLDLVAEVGSDKLDEGFFLIKRWDLAREFSQRFATGEQIASAIVRAKELGWPDDVWDRYPERLAATTRATIRPLMEPCVGREIVTIVGDAAVLRPQLEAAGLKLESGK